MVVYRNGFTYAANIFVLALALVMFATVSSQIDQFRIMCLTCVAIGSITTIFYIMKVKERSLSRKASERELNYRRALGKLDESVDS